MKNSLILLICFSVLIVANAQGATKDKPPPAAPVERLVQPPLTIKVFVHWPDTKPASLPADSRLVAQLINNSTVETRKTPMMTLNRSVTTEALSEGFYITFDVKEPMRVNRKDYSVAIIVNLGWTPPKEWHIRKNDWFTPTASRIRMDKVKDGEVVANAYLVRA